MPRLTICPQGLPADPTVREACVAVLLRAGADAQRIIEGDGWPLDRFAAHLGRLQALRGAGGAVGSAPLVVLTRTNPVALAVLQTRRQIEESVPELERAAWLVFHDPALDPFFESSVAGIGTLEEGVDWASAPVWSAPHGYRFLIVGPHPDLLATVAERVAWLESGGLPPSGELRLFGSGDGADAGPLRRGSGPMAALRRRG